MTTIATTDVQTGDPMDAGVVNGNFTATKSTVNGNLDHANLSASAGLARTKLATVTRKAVISGLVIHPFQLMGPSSTFYVGGFFMVPEDYVSGDITVQMRFRLSAANSGIVVWDVDAWRLRPGDTITDLNYSTFGQAMGGISAEQTFSKSEFVLDADIQAEDFLWYRFGRIGGSGSDTYTGSIYVDGMWIEYEGTS